MARFGRAQPFKVLDSRPPAIPLLDATPALLGQSLAISQGSLLANLTLAFSGQESTVSQGGVIAGFSFELSSQSLAVSQGSIGALLSIALSGQSLTTALGIPVQSSGTFIALDGYTISIGQGSLNPQVNLSSLALIGNSMAISLGQFSFFGTHQPIVIVPGAGGAGSIIVIVPGAE